LDNAMVLFDQEYRPFSRGELLNPAMKKAAEKSGKGSGGGKKSGGKKSRRGGKNQEENEEDEEAEKVCQKKVYNAEILIDDEADDCQDLEVQDSGSRLILSGKMTLRVYLHPEATVLEAVEAIKEDLMRTISARLDIHCDSLVGDDTKGTDQPNVPVIHEPPRRCLIALPDFKRDHAKSKGDDEEEEDQDDEDMMDDDDDEDSGKRGQIMVSDFLFPGETPYESVDSVREVFGFYPRMENMDDDLELVASPQQIVQQVRPNGAPPPGAAGGPPGGAPPSTQQEAEALKRARHRKFNTIAFGLSALVILIGVLISYFSIAAPITDPKDLAEEIAKAFNTKDGGGDQQQQQQQQQMP